MAPEEGCQRHAHAQVTDEVHEGLVDSAGLRGLSIHAGGFVVGADLLAVEYDQAARPVALFHLHAQPIRAAQGEPTHLVPLDLLAGRLDSVVRGVHRHAQSRCASDELTHSEEQRPRVGR
jgi:hypothetical protein